MVKKSLHINKLNSIKRLFWTLLIVVAINYISNVLHFRFDLTSEKKYTLTDNTKLLLKNLKDPVFVEVYLEGNNLPTGIKKLRNETKDLLEEFRILSKGKVEYHFFNIDKIKDEKKKEDFQKTLAQKGLFPTNVQVKSEGGFQEKLVFPGALVKVKGKELPIQILENQIQGPQQSLDNSINFLEYKIANSINKIAKEKPPVVAFVTDKGGPGFIQVSDFVDGLRLQNFQVQKIDISTQALFRQGIDILVIAKPTQRFSEEDKFKIDQYLMHGGKVMWTIDQNIADLDSFKSARSITSVLRDLNLTDILFKYGVRLNNELLLDLYCNPIPLVQEFNGQPQTKFFPWVFNPIIPSQNNHPIIKNLDPVAIEFASSLDTIRTKNINKTILLQSSQYSRLQATPFEIYLEGASIEPAKEMFNRSNIPIGVLLEGIFPSFYGYRITPELQAIAQQEGFKSIEKTSTPTKMIVISDGDICENEVDQNGNPLPLGYYKYTKETFANKTFLINCMEYLIDDFGLIAARNREGKMKLLDTARVKDAKSFWQLINIGLPLLFIFLIGIIYNRRRKAKYAR